MQLPGGVETLPAERAGSKINEAPRGEIQSALARQLKLRQASSDLEAIFITYLFKAMEKTMSENSISGSKNTLSSMLFSSVMGQAVADQGGIGLADIIYRSLRGGEERNPEEVVQEVRREMTEKLGLSRSEEQALGRAREREDE